MGGYLNWALFHETTVIQPACTQDNSLTSYSSQASHFWVLASSVRYHCSLASFSSQLAIYFWWLSLLLSSRTQALSQVCDSKLLHLVYTLGCLASYVRLVSPSQASKPFALPVVLFLAVLPQLPLVPLGHPLTAEWWSVFFLRHPSCLVRWMVSSLVRSSSACRSTMAAWSGLFSPQLPVFDF